MEFDVIQISPEELSEMSVIQMKMLRTAQQKKDELTRKAEKEIKAFKAMAMTAGIKNSTVVEDKLAQINEELEYQSALLADNLMYNMSLNEPTTDGDLGGSGGDEGAGYIVDYSLSYYDRYVIVRDYYFAIENPVQRMALYSVDDVARKYLSQYYSTLYDVLYVYSK